MSNHYFTTARDSLFAVLTVITVASLVIVTEHPDNSSPGGFVAKSLLTQFGWQELLAVLVVAVALCVVAVLRPAALPWFVVVAVGYMFVTLAALHVMNPELRPFKYVMSAFALRSPPSVFGSVVIASGLGQLAVGLRIHAARQSWKSLAILLVLSISLAGSIVGAAYPMDESFPPVTASGRLHHLSGLLSFGAFAVLPLASTLALGESGLGRTGRRLCLGFGFGSALGSVLVVPLLDAGYAGLAQRLSLAFFSAWMIAASFYVTPSLQEDSNQESLKGGG